MATFLKGFVNVMMCVGGQTFYCSDLCDPRYALQGPFSPLAPILSGFLSFWLSSEHFLPTGGELYTSRIYPFIFVSALLQAFCHILLLMGFLLLHHIVSASPISSNLGYVVKSRHFLKFCFRCLLGSEFSGGSYCPLWPIYSCQSGFKFKDHVNSLLTTHNLLLPYLLF